MPSTPSVTKPAGAYEVARPSGKCAVTGEPIPVGEKYMALLRETATGMERLDISLPAWKDFDKSSNT